MASLVSPTPPQGRPAADATALPVWSATKCRSSPRVLRAASYKDDAAPPLDAVPRHRDDDKNTYLTRRQRELIHEGANSSPHEGASTPNRIGRIGRTMSEPMPSQRGSSRTRAVAASDNAAETSQLHRQTISEDAQQVSRPQHHGQGARFGQGAASRNKNGGVHLPALSLEQKLNQVARQQDLLYKQFVSESDVTIDADVEKLVVPTPLTPAERRNAGRILLSGPQRRQADDVRALVAFSRHCDCMYGLSAAERTELMKGAEGRRADGSQPVIRVGATLSPVYVVVEGCCEYYTTHGPAEAARVLPIKVRSRGLNSMLGGSAAAAPKRPAQPPPARGRRGRRDAIVGSALDLTADSGGIFVNKGDGGKSFFAAAVCVPQQVLVREHEAFGLERAMHNVDKEAVMARGYRNCMHTLCVSGPRSSCTLLEFTASRHVELLRRAHEKRVVERAQFLRSVASLSGASDQSKLKMAAALTRLVRNAKSHS